MVRTTSRIAALAETLDLLRGEPHKTGMLRYPRVLPIGCTAVVSVALLLASCTSVKQTVGGWWGSSTPTPTTKATAAQAPRVYYAGVEGLKLYGAPSSEANVVGSLSLYEKVARLKLDRGYAYVESAKTGMRGWVKNAQLVWRIPTAPTTAGPAPQEEEPEEPEAQPVEPAPVPPTPEATATAAEVPPTATPVPAATRTPKATPAGLAPSIFNPY